MEHKYPTAFARFYDVIYHQLRDGVDNQFFLNEIKNTKGKILEIGVGTGRFFKDALAEKADIYGIDVSDAMLEVLKKKLGEENQNRISLQNIVDFHFDYKFDLIIAPFRVFMHLLNKKDQLDAINNVFNHLNPGGKFIFDVFIPDLNQLLNGLSNHTDFEGEYEQGKRLKRTVTTKPDLINQIINVHFHLEWEENNQIYQDDWEIPLRYFFRYELEHLLDRSHFESYRIFGDYHLNNLSNNSKEFIIIGTK